MRVESGERGIYTGDADLHVITAEGMTCETFSLKKD